MNLSSGVCTSPIDGLTLYALDHNITRLAIDHALAKRLADGLAGVAGLQVEVPRTYIVFVDLMDNGGGTKARSAELIPYLKSRGVLATGLYWLRFVVHMDVDAAGIDLPVQAIQRLGKTNEPRQPRSGTIVKSDSAAIKNDLNLRLPLESHSNRGNVTKVTIH